MKRMHVCPRGFSLVELLVVIGILGVLGGMLLPAVQSVRESAKLMECGNNLHQIGVAMHAYHDAHQRFPNSWTSKDLPDPSLGHHGWNLFGSIREYMEQNHDIMESSPIRSYFCPGRRDPSAGFKFDYCPFPPMPGEGFWYWWEPPGEGLSDGDGPTWGPVMVGNNYGSPWGSYGMTDSRSVSEVSDGTSNTLLLAHKGVDPEFYYQPLVAPPGGEWYQTILDFYDGPWYGNNASGVYAEYSMQRDPYGFMRDRTGGYYSDFWFFVWFDKYPSYLFMTSPHRAGMPLLWADGSVRTIAYTTDNSVELVSYWPTFQYSASNEAKLITYLWMANDGENVPARYLGQ